MPLDGDSKFKELKKAYAGGIELRGKTLGIIGMGRIGQATARIALGLGMQVTYYDPYTEQINLELAFHDGQKVSFELNSQTLDSLLGNADFITIHVPAQKNYILGKSEFAKMKKGAGLVNAARGGVVDEIELLQALDSGHLSFAGLDVFESEPRPEIQILMHPKISLTPHIGAATKEAQNRIGLELAEQIKKLLG